MSTVRDLIKGSLRLIGAIASGETPNANELDDALNTLNQMLDSWSAENLSIYAKVREEFSFIPAQQSYTMGPSGDFDTSRPVSIDAVTMVDANSTTAPEYPVDLIYVQEWAGITDKSTQSSLQTKLYVENSYPLLKLYFWPIPSLANKAAIYSLKPLTQFSSISDNIILPPGYEKALRYNLAIELAPEYGPAPSEIVYSLASISKSIIKRKNIQPTFLKCDPGTLAQSPYFDIRTGE